MGMPISHGKLALACLNVTNVQRLLIDALRESGVDEEWRNGTVTAMTNDALKRVVELQGQLHDTLARLGQEKQESKSHD